MFPLNNVNLVSRCSVNLVSKSLGGIVRSCHHSAACKDTKQSTDIETHTGQAWDSNDPRMARFLVAPKQVNPNWSINLITQVPSIGVKSRIAVCEGGPSEAVGHPKIFINVDEPGSHSCIYCAQKFHKESSH